jgi:hypothetical protein
VLLAVGAVLILVGIVWFLQGINVLGGSGMSGKLLWAFVGPVVAAIGAGILVGTLARGRTERSGR